MKFGINRKIKNFPQLKFLNISRLRDRASSNSIKKIAFVALSSPPDVEKVKRAAVMLESSGYKIVIKPSVFKKTTISYLASDIKTRVADIHSCWKDKSIDMIVAVRGGYGSAHLLPHLDWDLLKTRDIPFLGYSDLTAIHLAFYAKGIGIPISGPMAQNFSNIESDEYTKNSLLSVFSKKYEILPLPSKKIKILKQGKAAGPILPVTLSVMVTLIGTEYLPNTKNCILLAEDINEPIYKFDRYFTQLNQSGILGKLSGLMLGSFKRCGNETDRLKLFTDISNKINGPVVMKIPFGHNYPRISVAFGSKCSLNCNAKIPTITIENIFHKFAG